MDVTTMKCSCGKKLRCNNKSGLCTKCYGREYQKKYLRNHPIQAEINFYRLVKCMRNKAINESENRLKNDPERLTMEFKHSYIDDIVSKRLKKIK